MRILLPPSETKRAGGDGGPVALSSLAFPELTPLRAAAVAATERLAADPTAAVRALKLGPKLVHEVSHNTVLSTSPTMPALDRFTGVLFDALDAESLTDAERTSAARRLLIHSALWGPVSAGDPIPAYRLSHDSRLPALGATLKRHWAGPVTASLAELSGVVLDLRSESYAGLGPLPAHPLFRYVRVVTRMPDGTLRSLNHFNKQGKGRFARAVAAAPASLDAATSIADVVEWARAAGFELTEGATPGELDLVVDE